MLQGRILWTTLGAFCFIGCHAAFNIENSIGEIMLSPVVRAFSAAKELSSEPSYQHTVQFYLYTKKNPTKPQQLTINGELAFNESNFDTAKKTLVVIHGFRSDSGSPSELDIKNAALEFHDVNVIEVDWKYFTESCDYSWSVSHVKGVGEYIGQFLEWLISQGVKETDLHLIGHSLGAHVAGFAGKKLRADNLTAARISGLDPAFPGYYSTLADSSARLDSDDANFVDCIHTCSGKLGYPTPICQADFYPNGGLDVQPGCTILDFGTCSHKRSYQYFAESFNPNHYFNAESCKGIAIWAPYNCHAEGALMGYPASPQFKGPLTLKTNSKSPFAKNVTAV